MTVEDKVSLSSYAKLLSCHRVYTQQAAILFTNNSPKRTAVKSDKNMPQLLRQQHNCNSTTFATLSAKLYCCINSMWLRRRRRKRRLNSEKEEEEAKMRCNHEEEARVPCQYSSTGEHDDDFASLKDDTKLLLANQQQQNLLFPVISSFSHRLRPKSLSSPSFTTTTTKNLSRRSHHFAAAASSSSSPVALLLFCFTIFLSFLLLIKCCRAAAPPPLPPIAATHPDASLLTNYLRRLHGQQQQQYGYFASRPSTTARQSDEEEGANDVDAESYHHIDEELEELASELGTFQKHEQQPQPAISTSLVRHASTLNNAPFSRSPVMLYNRCSHRYVHVLGKRVRATGLRTSPYAQFILIPVISAATMQARKEPEEGLPTGARQQLPALHSKVTVSPASLVSNTPSNKTGSFLNNLTTMVHVEVDELTARVRQKLAALYRSKQQPSTTTQSPPTTTIAAKQNYINPSVLKLLKPTANNAENHSGTIDTVDELKRYFPWTTELHALNSISSPHNSERTENYRIMQPANTDAAVWPLDKWSSNELHYRRRKRSLLYANVYPPSSNTPQQEQRRAVIPTAGAPAATTVRRHFVYVNNQRFRAPHSKQQILPPKIPAPNELRARLLLPTSGGGGVAALQRNGEEEIFDRRVHYANEQTESLPARILDIKNEHRVQQSQQSMHRAVAIYNDQTGLYICLNKRGKPIARRKFKSSRCLFDRVDSHHGLYTRFRAATSSSEDARQNDLNMYLGFAANGRPEKASALVSAWRYNNAPTSLDQCFDFVVEPSPAA